MLARAETVRDVVPSGPPANFTLRWMIAGAVLTPIPWAILVGVSIGAGFWFCLTLSLAATVVHLLLFSPVVNISFGRYLDQRKGSFCAWVFGIPLVLLGGIAMPICLAIGASWWTLVVLPAMGSVTALVCAIVEDSDWRETDEERHERGETASKVGLVLVILSSILWGMSTALTAGWGFWCGVLLAVATFIAWVVISLCVGVCHKTPVSEVLQSRLWQPLLVPLVLSVLAIPLHHTVFPGTWLPVVLLATGVGWLIVGRVVGHLAFRPRKNKSSERRKVPEDLSRALECVPEDLPSSVAAIIDSAACDWLDLKDLAELAQTSRMLSASNMQALLDAAAEAVAGVMRQTRVVAKLRCMADSRSEEVEMRTAARSAEDRMAKTGQTLTRALATAAQLADDPESNTDENLAALVEIIRELKGM